MAQSPGPGAAQSPGPRAERAQQYPGETKDQERPDPVLHHGGTSQRNRVHTIHADWAVVKLSDSPPGTRQLTFRALAELAEREGFEPSIEFPLYTLSKRAPSATRPSLRKINNLGGLAPKKITRFGRIAMNRFDEFIRERRFLHNVPSRTKSAQSKMVWTGVVEQK